MLNNFKVRSRLFFLTALAAVVAIIITVFGLNAMSSMTAITDEIYNNQTQSLGDLGLIDGEINKLTGDIFRAFQHDPATPAHVLHSDHSVEEHLKSAEERMQIAAKAWDAYYETHLYGDEKVKADQYRAIYDNFVAAAVRPTLDAIRANNYSIEVVGRFVKEYRSHGTELEEMGMALIELNRSGAESNFHTSVETYNHTRTWMVIVFIIGLILSSTVSWLIIRSIVAPLTNLQATISQAIQNSDLTRRVDVSGSDEVGQTAISFNQMMQALQKALKKIVSQVAETSKGVEALTTVADQVAKSSASQSSSTAAMAASVEEMTVSINTVSSSADDAQTIAHDAGDTSEEGGKIIERTTTEMSGIAQVVGKASEVIQELGEESKQISSVVQVIKEVADQTNLLALNAAIEAARAGEHGRGFAVVADEVRKLAERTTQSTIDISTMIGKIQVSANDAVEEMGRVVQQVESGQALAQEAGERMVSIREKSHKVSDAITEISNALKEQNQASQEISRHVENISQMTEENSAAAEETASAAKNLDQLATSVKKTVEQFKV